MYLISLEGLRNIMYRHQHIRQRKTRNDQETKLVTLCQNNFVPAKRNL